MGEYIALDAHKRYTFASVERDGEVIKEGRIEHGERGAIRDFLRRFESGSQVAVETTGNWYWIVDEIEEAGMVPHLVHAGKARARLGEYQKTDRLDARGLNLLQTVGRLPEVWIPAGELRDQRELPRTRMMLRQVQTKLKNRVHSTLMKYGLELRGKSDIFAPGSRKGLLALIGQLPEHTGEVTRIILGKVDAMGGDIKLVEQQIADIYQETEDFALVKTAPGIGPILGVVIVSEVGDVNRFARASSLAAYSGTTPRVSSSGGKTRLGKTRPDVNRYLKWAFFEAANVICRHRKRWPGRHVAKLYERICSRKGHAAAIGAVGRHLAEATWWMLSTKKTYRDPSLGKQDPIATKARARK
jgi:transposase